jgi:hypothetical protein
MLWEYNICYLISVRERDIFKSQRFRLGYRYDFLWVVNSQWHGLFAPTKIHSIYCCDIVYVF